MGLMKRKAGTLALHKRGVLTAKEAAWALFELAGWADYETRLFESVPEPVSAVLRELGDTTWPHPGAVSVVRTVCKLAPPVEGEEEEQELRDYWSARRCREFFFPERTATATDADDIPEPATWVP